MKVWKDWGRYDKIGRQAIIVARGAIMLNDSKVACIFTDKQKHLYYYAEIRGTDADTIRDTRLSDVGLTPEGTKTYDLGNQVVTVRLQSDYSFLVELPTGKTAKSIPKKDADETLYELAKKDLAQMKKDIKKIVKNRSNLLFEDFLSGNSKDPAVWTRAYNANAILKQTAKIIVWSQGNNTFTMSSTDGLIDSNEQPYTLTDKPVKVAHPMEMQQDDVFRWQKYFTRHQLKQPFKQIWGPVRTPNEIKEDRYADCDIPFYRFTNQEKHGIYTSDFDFHAMVDVTLGDMEDSSISVRHGRHSISPDDGVWISKIKFRKYTRLVNHIIAYLDSLTIWRRIRNDDVSIVDMLSGFTMAQMDEFISVAQEANAVNVLAQLLDYKNKTFADFNPMDEFTLDW